MKKYSTLTNIQVRYSSSKRYVKISILKRAKWSVLLQLQNQCLIVDYIDGNNLLYTLHFPQRHDELHTTKETFS